MSNIDNKILQEEQRLLKIIQGHSDGGERAQTILETSRKIVEHCLFKKYLVTFNTDIDFSYQVLHDLVLPKARGGDLGDETRRLALFHGCLDVFSHESMDEEIAKALFYQFYPKFCFVRSFAKKSFGIDVFKELENGMPPLSKDDIDFYSKISSVLDIQTDIGWNDQEGNIYTIVKQRSFFVNKKTYYELVLDKGLSKERRADCFVAFTKTFLPQRCSMYFTFIENVVQLNGFKMPFKTVATVGIHVRAIEIQRLGYILGIDIPKNINRNREYKFMMNSMEKNGVSLADIAQLNLNEFNEFVESSDLSACSTDYFLKILKKARNIVKKREAGSNILLLLMHTMNNRLLRDQINWLRNPLLSKWEIKPNPKASNLCVKNKSLPFDQMPFASSPAGHPIANELLMEIFDPKGREHEFLARSIDTQTDNYGVLYVPDDKVFSVHNIDYEIEKYNELLPEKHKEKRQLVHQDKFIFVKGYEATAKDIITTLLPYSKTGNPNYTAFIDQQMNSKPIDKNFFLEEKISILKTMFQNSRIAIINGAAGTGKSTFISLALELLGNLKPLVLTKTNASAENLKQKVDRYSESVLTLDSYFAEKPNVDAKLYVIDESSTISNDEMLRFLETIKSNDVFLLFVGDEHQIESIHFGNWFVLSERILSSCCFQLKTIYRAKDKAELQKLWEACRTSSDSDKILTLLGHGDYTKKISDFSFNITNSDSVVLCLNYDGLYGINNINRIMQANNPGESFRFRDSEFRVGDPVIFSKCLRIEPYIHNGMHGVIKNIEKDEHIFVFTIQIQSPMSIPFAEKEVNGFQYLGKNANGMNEILIKADEKWDQDEDIKEDSLSFLPFEISYAVSIHKAQGLEYSDVRIVVTDNVAERITPNIFYTAITRTTNTLKIYWSAVSAKSITGRLVKTNSKESDISIFRKKYPELFM